MNSAQKTQAFIIKHVGQHPQDIVAFTVQSMSITRTTVRRHLNHLIREGKIFKTGTTRNTYYSLNGSLDKKVIIKLPPTTGEFEIFKENFEPLCSILPKNIHNICAYGVTEMINNAFEHSNGKKVTVSMSQQKTNIIFSISDDGVGIFAKISEFLHFHEMRESILQLNKGKFTTDHQNHTGEGIFFTSRVFDTFSVSANKINYVRDNLLDDWFIQSTHDKSPGTCVTLTINQHSPQTLSQVFQKFQDPESFAFDRTEIIVELSRFGEETYISRSQAKRILRNLEAFKIITLDFKSVEIVGQGFCDEIFRVYQNEYPDKQIKYIHANDDIIFMIKRSLATALLGNRGPL